MKDLVYHHPSLPGLDAEGRSLAHIGIDDPFMEGAAAESGFVRVAQANNKNAI